LLHTLQASFVVAFASCKVVETLLLTFSRLIMWLCSEFYIQKPTLLEVEQSLSFTEESEERRGIRMFCNQDIARVVTQVTSA